MSARWNTPRSCPLCGSQPWDPEEETCSNPTCRNHWTKGIENTEAAEAQRQAAIDNQRRFYRDHR